MTAQTIVYIGYAWMFLLTLAIGGICKANSIEWSA